MININFMILSNSDHKLIYDAAECISETFAGIKIGQSSISEPLSQVCKLSKHDMMDFTLNYIKSIVLDGLCVIAIDNTNGKVVGAMLAENYDPTINNFDFNGKSKSIFNIFNFLSELDKQFLSILESTINRQVIKNEYVHGTMFGVRTALNKKYIASGMLTMLINESSKQGYKAIFVEATNLKSQKFNELNGFYTAKGLDGNAISKKYATHNIFYKIPEDIGSECLLMIKPLTNNHKILF